MFNQIKNFSLLNNSKIILICLFLLTAGISTGIFSASFLNNPDKLELASIMTNNFSNSHNPPFINVCLTNIGFLLIIFFAGLSVYGIVFAAIILISRTFAFGFCAFLLLYSNTALKTSIILSFMFTNLLLCLILAMAAAICFSYAAPQLKSQNTITDNSIPYFFSFLLLAISTVIISLLH